MILDLQSILSDRQTITGADRTYWSTNFIDLGDYNSADSRGNRRLGRIAGYPAKVGASVNTPDYIGRQPYEHRLGASNLPFFGVVNQEVELAANANITSFTVGFCVGTAGPTSPSQSANPAGHEVISSVTLPIEGGKVTKGTQIPWPSIPRYLTKRYFYLLYTLVGTGNVSGVISAGFTPHIASEL